MPKKPKPEDLPNIVGKRFNFWSSAKEVNFQRNTGIGPLSSFTVVAAKYNPAFITPVGGIGSNEEYWEMTIQNAKGQTVKVTDYSGGPFSPFSPKQ